MHNLYIVTPYDGFPKEYDTQKRALRAVESLRRQGYDVTLTTVVITYTDTYDNVETLSNIEYEAY